MKRLLFLFLLLPSLAWGQVSTSGVSLSGCSTGGGAAAQSCGASPYESYPASDMNKDEYAYPSRYDGRTYYGVTSSTDSVTICKICFFIPTGGVTGTPTITPKIWSKSGTSLDTLLCTFNGVSSLTGNAWNCTDTAVTCSISSTPYAITLQSSDTYDGSNFIYWPVSNNESLTWASGYSYWAADKTEKNGIAGSNPFLRLYKME